MAASLDKEKLVLRKLLGESKYITPVLDEKYGYRFPTAEKELGLGPEETKAVLDKLVAEGFLEKRQYTVVRSCVFCGGQNFIVLERCPECKSRKVKFNTVIQHLSCGYSGVKSEFEVEKGKLTCPLCGKALVSPGEYKVIGHWYKCSECGSSFSEPVHVLGCLKCKNETTLDESDVKLVYEYEIIEEKIKREVPSFEIGRLEEAFSEKWMIESPSTIDGKSGVSHIFTVALVGKTEENKDRRIILDIDVEKGEVGEEVITRFYAKSVDVGIRDAVLLVSPKLTDRARKIAETLNVKFFEGKSVDEMLLKLKGYVEGKSAEQK